MAAFRFALQASHAASPGAWRELARKTEDLGYATLYVPDHLGDQWAPMVALTVAAEATTSLRVGTLVLDNDFRHPVVMAMEAATLDVVTGGRFELGLGAGWMTTDYEQSGITMDPPGVRVARLAECIEILRALWDTGSATYEGEHYRVRDVRCVPRAGHAWRSAVGHRRREPAHSHPGRPFRRDGERRAQPRRRPYRPRDRGRGGRREVRRACALGPRRGGGAPVSSCSAGPWRCRSSRTRAR